MTNCLFTKTGGNALYVSGAALELSVSNNEFAGIGDTGIIFAGKRHQSSGSSLIFPRLSQISNNYIHDQGYYEKHAVGIFVATADRIVISNNLVHDVPRACVNINDPFYGGHIVEYNRMYNCMKESADCGPFNTFGRTRFWSMIENHVGDYPIQGAPAQFPAGPVYLDALRTIIVRNNWISFVLYEGHPHSDWVQNIDMDDGSSNLNVYENVCEGASIKIGAYGDIHSVENNIVVDAISPVFFWNPMLNNQDYFQTNIIYSSSSAQNFSIYNMGGNSGIDPKVCESNLFYSVDTMYYQLQYFGYNLPLKDWQKKGYDVKSISGQDPLFYDAKKSNYTLRPESPAFKIGFHNFPYGTQNPVGRWK